MPEPVPSEGDRPDPADDLILPLAAFDEGLRRGALNLLPDDDADSNGSSELRRACDFLSLLERVYPRSGGSGAGGDSQPRTIGRFQIQRPLGQGGFGVVYLALDPRLNRLVALKVPRLHTLADEGLQRRFVREARAAAALDHPHIVPILETGETGQVCYIASAYCEGADLEQWIKSTAPAAPRLAAGIVEKLAEATHYSHLHGILHRDLKPSNVLLAAHEAPKEADAEPLPFIPRITDFGLARFMDEGLGETASSVMGTPLYMAPEQAAGRGAAIGPETDVYALGVILYELLTGRPPFQGAGFVEILDQIRTSEPVSPSRLVRSIPRDLETICLKCLQKDPARRYATAQGLGDDLRAFREGRVISARPVAALETAHKWIRRRPLLAALMFVTVAAASSHIALQWRHSHRLEEHVAVLTALRAESEASASALKQHFVASEINTAGTELVEQNIESAKRRIEAVQAMIGSGTPPSGLEPEWNYVCRQIQPPPPEFELAGHEGSVYSVAVSADGKWLASGDHGNIHIWNLATKDRVARFAAHDGEVRALAFSPDGKWLASGGQFRHLKIWDTTAWHLTRSVDAHNGSIYCAAWSDDGRRIASGGRDGFVRISDPETLAAEQTIEVGNVVFRVRFESRSALLTADKGNRLSRWDLTTAPPLRRDFLHTASQPQAMDYANVPGGAFALLESGRFFVRGSRPGEIHHPLPGVHLSAVISTTGWCASATDNGLIHLWRWGRHPRDGASRQQWNGHAPGSIRDLAATPDGTRLISGGNDGVVKVWRVADFQQPTIEWLVDSVNISAETAFSPDGEQIASINDKGMVRVIRTNDGHAYRPLDLSDRAAGGARLAFAADNKTLFIQTHKGTSSLVVWKPGTKAPPKPLAVPAIDEMRGAPDGSRLALLLADKREVVIWDTATLSPVQTLSGEFAQPEFSPDGTRLAMLTWGEEWGGVTITDLATGHRRRVAATGGVTHRASFDGGGRRMAVFNEGILQLIDVATARTTESISTGILAADCAGLSFSPDGEVVAIALRAENGKKGFVQLFHLPTRRSLLSLRPYAFGVRNPQYSRDGGILACVAPQSEGEFYRGIILWRFDPARGASTVRGVKGSGIFELLK